MQIMLCRKKEEDEEGEESRKWAQAC